MQNKLFRELLETKFGMHIVDALLEKDRLRLKKGSAQDLYSANCQDINRAQLLKILPPHADLIQKNDWAFDFPGWTNELNLNSDCAKEIMILGMEPHIGKGRDFQICYGLRETSDNEYGELEEYNSNKMLWRNLYDLFGADLEYPSPEFLDKFYITDLSHFAIQGKAKAVLGVKEWKKIRTFVATTYLLNEIKLIKPKYIISQGNDVANFIEYEFLDKMGQRIAKQATHEFKTKLPPKCKNSPAFKKYSLFDRELIHLRLPHIGSPNGNYFWTPRQIANRTARLKGIVSELMEFKQK